MKTERVKGFLKMDNFKNVIKYFHFVKGQE